MNIGPVSKLAYFVVLKIFVYNFNFMFFKYGNYYFFNAWPLAIDMGTIPYLELSSGAVRERFLLLLMFLGCRHGVCPAGPVL